MKKGSDAQEKVRNHNSLISKQNLRKGGERMKQSKQKEILILSTLFVFLMASIAPAQEVIEKYRTGNIIEGLTYIKEGKLAGKLVLRDGLYVYSYDLDTDKYERLFCFANLGIKALQSGICSISTGGFSGNLLMNNSKDYSKLYIVSPSGTLVSEVSIVDFVTNGEGLTEITSGLYSGMFAMFENAYGKPNIIIFRIVDEGDAVNAYLVKNIVRDPFLGPWGICFLPDDFPDPQYRNHFLISEHVGPLKEITVIDDDGNKKISFPVDCVYEGLAYIDKGRYIGKLAVCGGLAPNAWIRNLDGTYETPLNVMAGIGLSVPRILTWLANENQLLTGRTFQTNNSIFYFLSRLAPENWEKDSELVYSEIEFAGDITDLLSDGYYYLLGYNRVWDDVIGSMVSLSEVHKLDSDFNLEAIYPLYSGEFYGKRFSSIFYNPDENKFGVVQYSDRLTGESLNNVCLFDSGFNYLETIDLSEITEKASLIWESYYDTETQRYYILNRENLILVFNLSWELIAECDISNLGDCGGSFWELTKITSGELQGNFILADNDNSELVVVNLEAQIVYSLSINTGTGGTTDPSPGVYSHFGGTEVTITAIPDNDYRFSSWTGDVPQGHENDNPITITMDLDKSIKANFSAIPPPEEGKKGGCFIATAAYGSPLHPYVKILRDFRDKWLMPNRLGREMVDFYYKYSPFVANLIKKHKLLKVVTRINLLPLVVFGYSMVHFSTIITAIMLVFIFILPIFFILFYQRKLRRVEARDPKALASRSCE